MTDASEPPAAASPYGPAPSETGTAESTLIPAAAAPVGFDRARRVLRIIAVSCGVLSVVALIALIVAAALGGGTANNDLVGVEATVTWVLIWASPVLAVVAINLLVWRALLRPLARMTIGKRVALIITMVIVLALLSVVTVTVLLFLGFFLAALFSAGSGFGA